MPEPVYGPRKVYESARCSFPRDAESARDGQTSVGSHETGGLFINDDEIGAEVLRQINCRDLACLPFLRSGKNHVRRPLDEGPRRKADCPTSNRHRCIRVEAFQYRHSPHYYAEARRNFSSVQWQLRIFSAISSGR